jgi:hypothetical protein
MGEEYSLEDFYRDTLIARLSDLDDGALAALFGILHAEVALRAMYRHNSAGQDPEPSD